MKKKYTEVDELQWIALYKAIPNISKLERDYGIPHTTLGIALRKHNIATVETRYTNKSKFKTRYIEQWDTLSEAVRGYICGIIASDGSVDKDRKRIELGMTITDRTVVEYVASTIVNPPAKIAVRKGAIRTISRDRLTKTSDSVRIKITVPKLYDFLSTIGVRKNKTTDLYLDYCKCSEEFLWHYFRGIIDGDGCIVVGGSISSNKIKVVSASLMFLENLQYLFGGHIYKRKKATNNEKELPLYDLEISGNQAIAVAHKLPKDSTYLKRKTDKLLELLTYTPKRKVSLKLRGSLVQC